METQPASQKSRTLTFFGPIQPPSTTNLRASICGFVNEGIEHVTILFASDGGSLHDGIALFTFLRAQLLTITMHAVGIVGSIAIPVFLAGDSRIASENSRFFFHEYNWTYGTGGTISHAMAEEQTLLLDSSLAWTKDVLKSRTKLANQDTEAMKLFIKPTLMQPGIAAKWGIADAVAEPSIAAGSISMVVA